MNDISDQRSILVVDDTRVNIGFLLETLTQAGYRVRVAPDGETAVEQVQYAAPDLVLLDVMMPGIDGFETCRRLRKLPNQSQLPVIFMTALADAQDKVRAFAAGANDYVTKPFQSEEVLARVRVHLARRMLETKLEEANRELESRVASRTSELTAALKELEVLKGRLQQENRYLKQEIEGYHGGEIVGSSPALQAVLSQVAVVAPTDCTVLIHGETGTGKELVARALHEGSGRRERPMIKLNCSAISAGLVESELFGHVKGAFTGATDRRVGRFELADGGTLFLDEVSELPLETQAKLLRVLQEQEFEPVGSSKTQKVNVRVIAATNRDLAADSRNGRFRADLFYRLNVFPLELPPLRERPEDIEPLALHFMRRMGRKMGKALSEIEAQTLAALKAHPWPGNIRDLQNTIERAAVLSAGNVLRVNWRLDYAEAVPPAAPAVAKTDALATPEGNQISQRGESQSLEAVERNHIIAILKRTRGVIEGPQGAARLLKMNASTTRFRIRKLGITRADFSTDSEL